MHFSLYSNIIIDEKARIRSHRCQGDGSLDTHLINMIYRHRGDYMPRQARIKSESGYYHILLRGIGKQRIFEDCKDREKFIEILKKYKEELQYKVIAYCLMENHVHLLIEDVNRQLDLMMKKIAGSYAYYFNWKYERVGHLFQDRFKSEPVEDDIYFLTVIRYIHQNPYKAGISEIGDYRWSSYSDYVRQQGLSDTEKTLEMLGGKNAFIEFVNENEERNCLDVSSVHRLTDEKAAEIIKRTINLKNIQDIQSFDVATRNMVLHSLKDEGISIRQLERLTGINRGVILKA